VVNPSGFTEPTVGWKRAPLSVVATRLVFPDKCYVLYFEPNACSCLYAHECFLYGSVCLCFDLETMDAYLYLYDHIRSRHRMNRFRIRVCALENDPNYLARVVHWLNLSKALLPGGFPAFLSRSESLKRATMIVNPRVYLTPTAEYIARRFRKALVSSPNLGIIYPGTLERICRSSIAVDLDLHIGRRVDLATS
jgi:hypothetical protein